MNGERNLKYKKIKRYLDFVFSIIAFIILLPVFLLIAVLIKVSTKGPILFKQKRMGKFKKEFYILKFRTMMIETPKDLPTHLLMNPEVYITKIGKLLRKTSLDELPQIINIIKGEMSFIGPRPALWNQSDLLEERDIYGANDLTPGLSGWAQINGRDELPIKIKARLDGEYVQNINFLMDVKCFFKTILSVVRFKGVVEGGSGVKSNEIATTNKTTSH